MWKSGTSTLKFKQYAINCDSTSNMCRSGTANSVTRCWSPTLSARCSSTSVSTSFRLSPCPRNLLFQYRSIIWSQIMENKYYFSLFIEKEFIVEYVKRPDSISYIKTIHRSQPELVKTARAKLCW